jgi:hypothetical protein
MSARDEIADFWDELTAAWLAGHDPMPDPLPRWYDSYRGRGGGEPTREYIAEPYGGDLRGDPCMVTLGLNPGGAVPEQARNGIFADAIRKHGSYSAWAATVPYMGERWERVHGRNRYGWNVLRFARRWLDDGAITPQRLLTLELYPWRSKGVTAMMGPPADIVDRFVWKPLEDIPVEFVFAFGKPWLRVCEALRLPRVGDWGHGGVDFDSRARSAAAFELPSGQWVIVSWQSAYAGPPGREDALRLRKHLADARGGMGV